MKHCPFQSIYRPDFEVVEQRQGKLSLYPHTDQLPLLLRALTLEFHGALPRRVAAADKHTDDFRKIVLKTAALMFCAAVNGARPDQLRLYALLNHDLVTEVSIVQQITETTPLGLIHRFRFYARDDFFPEIHLSGRRVVFSDHVLQRFSTRVPNSVGTDLTHFLMVFFGSLIISMPVGPGRAFVLPYEQSILAFTYQQTATEFFITTCLTINEINSLGLDLPVHAYNFHYGLPFMRPKIRNWLPLDILLGNYRAWERKTPLVPVKLHPAKKDWHDFANWVKGYTVQRGHGPGSRLCFVDNIPGPIAFDIRPHEKEPQIDELAVCKLAKPEYDWDAAFAEMIAETS